MLKLRRILWDNGLPSIGRQDYEVVDERGEKIGRMYRTNAVGGREAWNWTVYGIAVWNSPPAGREPTRERPRQLSSRHGHRATHGNEGVRRAAEITESCCV